MWPINNMNELNIDNDGKVYKSNRQNRRRFLPDDPDKTKSTWARQNHKEIKRKRKLGRK